MKSNNTIKPLPYLMQKDSYPVAEGAKWLRDAFGPILKRRLPAVLYYGWHAAFWCPFGRLTAKSQR